MKNCLLFILITSFTAISWGQIHEVGVFAGSSNYIGDIGRTNYLYPSKLAGGIIYKWNWNPRIALRGTFSHLPITGDDKNADTDFRVNRNFKFNNVINELALGLEYNFYEYDISSPGKSSTPYILFELAAFKYKSVKTIATNGDILYTDKTSYAVPFGVGYKSILSGGLTFALETKFRYTFEDDLDFSTGRFPALDYGRKGSYWYAFMGITLTYTFGRPPCFTTGL